MTTEPRPLGPGDRLGQLDIVKVLAKTGVSLICEARDVGTRETVAFKWVDRSFPGGVDHMKREYQHLARVRHPNVVAVHQFYFDPRGVLYTMELVRGMTLGEWLHGPGRPTSQEPRRDHLSIRHVFHQLALAVVAVHEAGLLHRDITRDNVLVTPEDRVVLIDFWCCREYGPDLYEALTGRRPFQGRSVIEVLSAKLTERPPRPSELVPSTPRDLDALCMALLDREPQDRPTADHVLACLA